MPEQSIIDGFKGKIDFYLYMGIPVARRWPRSPGHNRAPAVQAQWVAFAEAARLWSTLAPEVKAAWEELAADSDLTAKDWFTRGYISGYTIEE